MKQTPLPEKTQYLNTDQAFQLIRQTKELLAERLVILGHHYQRDEIFQFADFAGDSLKLSQIAAEQKQAEFIVFCGVHFMAESADVLSTPDQKVLLPHLDAGCSMAEMADLDQVEDCWEILRAKLPHPEKLVPINYVNSTADIKAFCGRHGGICCTSGNCRQIFEWVWSRDPDAVILFLPDQHLGRNTAYAMGVELEQMFLWDPTRNNEPVGAEQFADSRIILWDGSCCVHQEFTTEQIEKAHAEDPDVKVIVHPECNFDVAQSADYVGSTEQILNVIRAAEAGSSWAVGTEVNMVNRLKNEMAPRNIKVRLLSDTACLCEDMSRIDPAHLTWILDRIGEYVKAPKDVELPNKITVSEDIKRDARKALEKMLDITAGSK